MFHFFKHKYSKEQLISVCISFLNVRDLFSTVENILCSIELSSKVNLSANLHISSMSPLGGMASFAVKWCLSTWNVYSFLRNGRFVGWRINSFPFPNFFFNYAITFHNLVNFLTSELKINTYNWVNM